jgi:hypothetical protein
MSRALPYLWYPLLFTGAIVAFAAMLAAGVTVVLSTYLPILVAGLRPRACTATSSTTWSG